MKKSLIFFPVFMLLLGGCGTKSDTSGTGTSVTPTSSVAPAPSSSGVAPTSSQGSSHSPVPSSSETPPVTQYTITWKDDLGNNLKVEQVAAGVVPSYGATNPTKTGDAQYSYEFDHWNPTPVAATANAVYTAVFTSTVKKYTISFVDGDGKELQSSQVEYGTTPTYSGETPTKTAGAHSTYTWDGGWDPALAPVTGNATYEATFTENVDKYTVRFLVDGVQYGDPVQVEYGKYAPAPGVAPSKDPDAEVARYVFDGWEGIDQPITENTDLNASFIEYAVEEVVDNFASYDEDHPVDDNTGWEPVKLDGSWGPSSAPIDISENSMEGDQALRFLGYRNGLDFGIRKTFDNDQPARYANAVKIKMMTPSDLKASAPKFILNFTVDMAGTPLGITLKHAIPAQTAEWFEVVIPFAHDQWQIWDQEYGSIESIAAGRGLSSLDPAIIPTMLDDFIIYVAYPTGTPQRFATYIDSVSFVTTDSAEVTVHDLMDSYTRYTGYTLSGNVARVDITSATEAHFRIIDLASPVDIQGEYTVNGNSLVFNSDVDGLLDYEGRITDNGQKIEFVSVSSSNAQLQTNLTDIKLNAVQVLEDAESYSAVGVGYSRDHAEDTRSGARGAYFMELYNGSSGVQSPFGKGDWKLMGNGEQINLKNDANAHSGSKYLAFQNFNGRNARYLQWNLFKGNADLHRYRGAKLSFWLKSYSATTIDKLNFYALSKYNPTQGDIYEPQPSSCRRYEINSVVPQTWTHYELDIDPNGVYYGFAMLLKTSKDTWLHLDDVEIYTVSPYACAASGVSLSDSSAALALGETKQLTATVSPADASNKNVTWSTSNKEVATVDDNGLVTAVAAGNATITATTVVGGFTDTCDVSVAGDVSLDKGQTYSARIGNKFNALIDIIDESNAKLRVPGLSMNVAGTYSTNKDDVTFAFGSGLLTETVSADKKSLTFKSIGGEGLELLQNANFEMIFGEDADTYESAGQMYYQNMTDESQISGARGAYYCDYQPYGGSYQLMGGNGDQLDLVNDSVDGGKALGLKYSSGGQMRYLQWDLHKGTAIGKTGFNKFGFFMKNGTSGDAKFVVAVYKTNLITLANITDNSIRVKTEQTTIAAGTDWTYYEIELNPTDTYYGFSVWFDQNWKNKSGYISFDKAAFLKNSYENPFNNFFAYDGLALSGEINGGTAATLTFGANGTAVLNYGSDVPSSYRMFMYGGSQMLEITTPAGKITGTYVVSNTGVVTFTIVSATDSAASLVTAGQTFTS